MIVVSAATWDIGIIGIHIFNIYPPNAIYNEGKSSEYDYWRETLL